LLDAQDGRSVFGYKEEDGNVVYDAEVTPAAANVDRGRAIQ